MPNEANEGVQKLVQGVIAGNRLSLAKAITQVENETFFARPLLQALYPHAGNAHIVGVTGAPGTGKSTLVTELTRGYRKAGRSVAIVAIDPTSPFTGGALLGDRVRMRALSSDDGVFVRSMATRGNLGGLSKTSKDVVTLLDAAGFERILIETVGVGQAEVEIVGTAHTTVVVEAPGLGDEIQAIKAGVLEIADILVVNKADRSGADGTIRSLEMALGRSATQLICHHGQLTALPVQTQPTLKLPTWRVEVLKTVATSGDGVEALRLQVEAHAQWLDESGQRAIREQANAIRHLMNIIHAEVNRRVQYDLSPDSLQQLADQMSQRQIDPYGAANTLLETLFPNIPLA